MAPPPQQVRQQTSNCSLLLIYRPRKDERLSWPGWLVYPHKWSPISYRSSAGQRKHAGQRPMLYRWTTQPTPIFGLLWFDKTLTDIDEMCYQWLHRGTHHTRQLRISKLKWGGCPHSGEVVNTVYPRLSFHTKRSFSTVSDGLLNVQFARTCMHTFTVLLLHLSMFSYCIFV